ncbi:hypothetical protein EDC96DRAFT_542674 [Choanephora cucurbitarum]|nr:hypothetical protein EDC96DRAFT_542674 [Choanephora cucurbitarum]
MNQLTDREYRKKSHFDKFLNVKSFESFITEPRKGLENTFDKHNLDIGWALTTGSEKITKAALVVTNILTKTFYTSTIENRYTNTLRKRHTRRIKHTEHHALTQLKKTHIQKNKDPTEVEIQVARERTYPNVRKRGREGKDKAKRKAKEKKNIPYL